MRIARMAWVGVRGSTVTRRGSMDALKLLKEDHDRVKKMLRELDETTERADKTRTDGIEKLREALAIHEVIEEEIFYPALKEHAEAKDIVLEAYEEHDVVNIIMSEIVQTPTDDETWKAKFTVMKENLEHHIEEEEGEMFEKARDIFDKDVLEQLGERMQARKERGSAAA
jgi:hemerythrin-like domain-containing protein